MLYPLQITDLMYYFINITTIIDAHVPIGIFMSPNPPSERAVLTHAK